MVEKFFNSMDVEVYRSFLYALYSDNKNDLSDEDVSILVQNIKGLVVGADKTGSVNPQFANLVIAVELLINRPDIQEIHRFQSLGMSEDDITAIKFAADIGKFSPIDSPLTSVFIQHNNFIMTDIVSEENNFDTDMVTSIENGIGRYANEVIESGSVTSIVKLMLARATLNYLTTSVSFATLVPYIGTLSDFILSQSAVDTSNVGDLLNEVALKWK